jgi:DNA repair protein RecO (recombination protein O)
VKQNYHAIALDKRDIGEMDRLHTFYTLEEGLIRVPARSIRKVSAKLPMQVEDFVLTHITVAKNYGRGTLAGAVAEEYFERLRQNYDALLCVDIARNVFLTITDESDPDEKVFDLFVQFLYQMDDLGRYEGEEAIAKMQWITNAFLINVFALNGYVFDAKKCCMCKGLLAERRGGFSAHHGGVLCAQCLCGSQYCHVDPDTIKALRVIQDNPFSHLHKVLIHTTVHKQMNMVIGNIEQWVMR